MVDEGQLLSLSACNDLFSWSSTYSLGEVVIQNAKPGGPTLTFALGPLISLGGPAFLHKFIA